MKIAIVPASVLASEDKWTADAYVRDRVQDQETHARAVKMIQQGHTMIANVAKNRREARARQRRFNIQEIV